MIHFQNDASFKFLDDRLFLIMIEIPDNPYKKWIMLGIEFRELRQNATGNMRRERTAQNYFTIAYSIFKFQNDTLLKMIHFRF